MACPVAVIDIGSNTIKLLVAGRTTDGAIATLAVAAEEARLGTGSGAARPLLSAAGMKGAVEAVIKLLAAADRYSPRAVRLVATSAVRDAGNGEEFCRRIHDATGHTVRVLTGTEEAEYIGRGIATDPALAATADYYLFDLGGGSLECLTYREGRQQQACSLPLGCVRLTEMCVAAPSEPFGEEARRQVAARVRAGFAASPFRFRLPSDARVIATGGTITTVRAIAAARRERPIETVSPVVTRADLEDLLAFCGALPLERRRAVPGLPPERADIFPTALATFLTVLDLAGAGRLQHSFHNLRYGLAAELLASGG